MITTIHNKKYAHILALEGIDEINGAIRKRLYREPEFKSLLGIEFIRYVVWLLQSYYKIFKHLEFQDSIQGHTSRDGSCIITRGGVKIIKYEKITDKKLHDSVSHIAMVLRYLSEIGIELQVYNGCVEMTVDENIPNLFFKQFGIKTTTDLSKFVIQGAGGTRKNRRRKTSKSTKKHRKSSRRRS
jgi:hypothetical protein